MKAVLTHGFGGPEVMYIGNATKPSPRNKEVLVKIKATALNRADTMQRKGNYPPPPGASPILGLEFSGEIVTLGAEVTNYAIGDRVCGLLSGGGYAEFLAIHEDMAIGIPDTMSYTQAAAIPEVFLTAFQALRYLAMLCPSESVLIHAGASGVGTAAIQLARAIGAKDIIVTASASKHQICKNLGANSTIDYKSDDFEKVIESITDKKGIDVIIDFMGASYFQQNINCLAMDGRMVMLAFLGGIKAEVNLANILRKRLKIMGSTLRARSIDYKIALTRDFKEFALPLFQNGDLKPVIDSVYNWKDVIAAHEFMESNKNKGKIILEVSD
ncbi:MAG: tumor protein p53-inducible protein 3 [Saprospiraceae bacterium]|jgi:tumor protein p53-inducible protein 3